MSRPVTLHPHVFPPLPLSFLFLFSVPSFLPPFFPHTLSKCCPSNCGSLCHQRFSSLASCTPELHPELTCRCLSHVISQQTAMALKGLFLVIKKEQGWGSSKNVRWTGISLQIGHWETLMYALNSLALSDVCSCMEGSPEDCMLPYSVVEGKEPVCAQESTFKAYAFGLLEQTQFSPIPFGLGIRASTCLNCGSFHATNIFLLLQEYILVSLNSRIFLFLFRKYF